MTFKTIYQAAFLPYRLFVKFLLIFVSLYDIYVYSPIQTFSSPIVRQIPRQIKFGDYEVTIFTANGVTYCRTLLAIPIAIALKNGYYTTAFACVILHDYLDHLDGIVAKVQNSLGYKSDPELGSFLDAFCDKLINCTALWTILMLTDYNMTTSELLTFVSIVGGIILYEFVLGVVRVQDYYAAISGEERNLAASMEGKLKEKLESVGIALLCLSSPNPMASKVGLAGVICLFCSICLAHSSLMHKFEGRVSQPQSPAKQTNGKSTSSSPDISDSESKDFYDKVYTIGCFDLLHRGHRNLFRTMRSVGRTTIVGVHSDESIFKLKNKWPIDPLQVRIQKVKKYADLVFAIPDTDPTDYILGVASGENSVFIRGDDMPNFPSRAAVEEHMDVRLIPYTEGVSSTLLRKKLLEEGSVTPEEAI